MQITCSSVPDFDTIPKRVAMSGSERSLAEARVCRKYLGDSAVFGPNKGSCAAPSWHFGFKRMLQKGFLLGFKWI